MSPKTKKQLLIAGGIAGGALAIVTVIALASKSAAATDKEQGAIAPKASDADIEAVVKKALVVETDAALLRELATAMLVLPHGSFGRNHVGAVQERARELEAVRTNVQQNDGSATRRLGDFA